MIFPTIENITSALSFVSPEAARDEWVRVGMAIKDGLGDAAGLPVFDSWSMGGSGYDKRDVRDVWRSLRGSGVTVATLYDMALKNGWKQDSSWREENENDRLERSRRAAADDEKLEEKRVLAARIAANVWADADEILEAGNIYLQSKGLSADGCALRSIGMGKLSEIIGYTPKSSGIILDG